MVKHRFAGIVLAMALCGASGVAYAQENADTQLASDVTVSQVQPSLQQDSLQPVSTDVSCALTSDVFPDAQLLAQLQGLDANNDGALTTGEVTTLVIDNANITTLEGIDTIPGLEHLTIAHFAGSTVLDVSGCTSLKTLNVANNWFESITFPAQTLESVTFFTQQPGAAHEPSTFVGWSFTNGAQVDQVDIADESAVAPATIAGKTLYAVWQEAPVTGPQWQEIEGAWRYTVDGVALPAGIHELDGKTYWLDADGFAQTGWYVQDGNWSYFDAALGYGEMVIGWAEADGQRFYMNDAGVMQSGWLRLGVDEWYYLNEEHDGSFGAALTGWQWLDAWYYFNADGMLHYGWLEVDGETYYCETLHNGSFGAMRTGWVADPVDNDLWYYFWSDGSRASSGWFADGSTWYFLNDEGAITTGWYQDSYGLWYYFNPNHDGWYGAMHTGWLAPDYDMWYYLNSTGYLNYGWFYVDGYWYYGDYDKGGALKTGWLETDEGWYGFNPNHNGSYGAMIIGSEILDGKAYYFDTNGLWHSPGSVQQDMINRAQSYSSGSDWMLMVDTTNCWVGVFYNYGGTWEMEKLFRCSVGAPGSDTPTGQYSVTGKGYSFGHGYTCYYYTQFCGDYLFHSVTYYEGTFNIMEGAMGAHISAGCVRLEIHNAQWIYDNIPYGTRVVNY